MNWINSNSKISQNAYFLAVIQRLMNNLSNQSKSKCLIKPNIHLVNNIWVNYPQKLNGGMNLNKKWCKQLKNNYHHRIIQPELREVTINLEMKLNSIFALLIHQIKTSIWKLKINVIYKVVTPQLIIVHKIVSLEVRFKICQKTEKSNNYLLIQILWNQLIRIRSMIVVKIKIKSI